ncbi:MAG: hypothetical protein ABEK00_00205 [Candidatus Nanohaloarchaea archaeon]
MSAEQGLIVGLGIIAYLTWNLAENFKEIRDQMHKSLLALSTFFILGMEYTARGIAQSAGYNAAETAYTFSLVITTLLLLGMIYKIYKQVKEEAQSGSMEGLT